jgi:hypothetical protein
LQTHLTLTISDIQCLKIEKKFFFYYFSPYKSTKKMTSRYRTGQVLRGQPEQAPRARSPTRAAPKAAAAEKPLAKLNDDEELMLLNTKQGSGRYVTANGAVGREIRRVPRNADYGMLPPFRDYVAAAAALTPSHKLVATRSHTGSASTSAAQGPEVWIGEKKYNVDSKQFAAYIKAHGAEEAIKLLHGLPDSAGYTEAIRAGAGFAPGERVKWYTDKTSSKHKAYQADTYYVPNTDGYLRAVAKAIAKGQLDAFLRAPRQTGPVGVTARAPSAFAPHVSVMVKSPTDNRYIAYGAGKYNEFPSHHAQMHAEALEALQSVGVANAEQVLQNILAQRAGNVSRAPSPSRSRSRSGSVSSRSSSGSSRAASPVPEPVAAPIRRSSARASSSRAVEEPVAPVRRTRASRVMPQEEE